MASKIEIEMNFFEAKAQAAKLDDVADELVKLSNNKLNDTLQNVASAWKGDNASIYINKGTMLQGNITQNAAEFRSIAQKIREIAERIYNAEMANYERAKSREHS